MPTYKLSNDAKADIHTIAVYGILNFGDDQARLYQDEMTKQFELLADYPRLGRPFDQRRIRHLHRFGFGSHVIVYTVDTDDITVQRVVHGKANIQAHL